jgi:tumor protein p53-inducible protein 3
MAGTPDEQLSSQQYIALLSGGGYAQYAKVCKDHIILVPQGYDFVTAACVTEVWATAFQILHFVAKVEKNDVVLVHAAASGVGTSLI